MSAVVAAHEQADLLEFSPWARTQYLDKYSMQDEHGQPCEEWPDTARRVVRTVMGTLGYSLNTPECRDLERLVIERKFIPGGRYLSNTGMPYHQVNNCLASETMVVTREGTRPIETLAGTTPTLLTSNGRWIESEVRSFGTQPLMKLTVQRGHRQKEIYATAEHSWRIARTESRENGRLFAKEEILTQNLQPGMKLWEVFGFGISRTPLSQAGIQHGIVFGDGSLPQDDHGFNTACVRLCGLKDAQLSTHFVGYPSHSIEGGDQMITGLPRRYKSLPSLSEDDRSYLLGWLAGYFAADGCVSEDGSVMLHSTSYTNLSFVRDVCYLLGIGTYELRYQDRISNLTGQSSTIWILSFMRRTLTEDFFLIDVHRQRFTDHPPQRSHHWTVVSVESTDRVEEVFCAVVPETHEFVLADNILTGNCFLYRCEDSREGWADLSRKAILSLSSGGGIGVVYSDVRPFGTRLKRVKGHATGPLSPAKMVNEVAREVMAGSRRSAIWGGLHWWHQDIFRWIEAKDWDEDIRALKEKDFNYPAPLDMTNISVILDDDFFAAYHDPTHVRHEHARRVYWETTSHMVRHGEPGFSVNCGADRDECLRNACTEITSADDSDVCNLGSINMARIESQQEMALASRLGTLFLLAGTVYSDVPHAEVEATRYKNRRLGLGLMGVHEWLIARGYRYEVVPELREWLSIYEVDSDAAAVYYAKRHVLSIPVKVRAIAPNGTIGIIAETSTSGEPVLFVACKRRFLDNGVWRYQYVIDPTVERMRIEYGIDPDEIETAYSLAYNVERRIKFQADLQEYVDHGIASTINLPYPITDPSEVAEFGDTLLGYLPRLRGITCYPEGARAGQPFTPIPYHVAASQLGVTFDEDRDRACLSGVCGV